MNPEKQLADFVQTWNESQVNHPLWQDYKNDFTDYFCQFKQSREVQEFSHLTFFPCLDQKTASTPFDQTYYYQDIWASRKIFQSQPESVLDVGSTVLYSGIISQFVPTTFVDIRPIPVNFPGLTVIDGSIWELPFADVSQSFISSLGVMGHIGLGRYGEPIRPDGTRRACAEINRVLKPGGEIVVSVPVGLPCIAYNAHRIFSREQFLSYFPAYNVLDEIFLTPEPSGAEVLANLKEPGQFVVWVVHLAKAKNPEIENWIALGKPIPTPHAVKQATVRYHADKYSINTLVETGTYLGDMVFCMKDIFKKIVSIELGSDLYLNAKNRFWGISNVDIIQGDSGQVFPMILPKIEESCLFWLDGHYSAGITAKGDLHTPILQELQAIFSHTKKDNHVILIDDARCFNGQDDYPTVSELKELVSQQLPNHKWEIKDDIIRVCPCPDTAKKIRESDRFNSLAQSFLTKYNAIKSYSVNPGLILPIWDEWNKKLEEAILPIPPISFLKTPVIMQTMFVGYDRFYTPEISLLESQLSPAQLQALLREDKIGEPPVTTEYQGVLTSYNTVHHLHHLVNFFAHTKCTPTDINYVVEWGGGYGNLAKLFKRMKGNENLTYIIIDTALFSCLQWLYLGSIWGENEVNLIDDSSKSLVKGKINLLPLNFLDNYPIENEVDLFISTWALSECSDFAQNYVINHQCFNAKHLLLAYHLGDGKEFPFASRVQELAINGGASTEDINFIPGGHQYAFR